MKYEELLARARATLAAKNEKAATAIVPSLITPIAAAVPQTTSFSLPATPAHRTQDEQLADIFSAANLDPNEEQIQFIKLALTGVNCILNGAAGTGKTTTQGLMVHAMMHFGKIAPLTQDTKYLTAGNPGAVICSFTNKAVNNIRQKMPADLQDHCLTIHKLLEFRPNFYEIDDPETGEPKKTMRFEPSRNASNPLPASLKLIVIEESSMVDVPLYNLLMDACPHTVQVILLGDLNQLPPVFGQPILGYQLMEWPIVELTRIYRQALESPIISFAWKIKSGIELDEKTVIEKGRMRVPAYEALHVPNKLTLRPWQKKLDSLSALYTAVQFFRQLYDHGMYDPLEDIILIPFNKEFGSIELDKGIAQYLGDKRGAVVHEIIAGFNKHYLAVGDKIMYAKEDCMIVDIVRNGDYLGKAAQLASKFLNRWGHKTQDDEDLSEESTANKDISMDDIDKMLAIAVAGKEERVNKASHTIILRRIADDAEITISNAGEVNNILGGYAITVHKAQGSEWRKVFVVLHHSHAVSLNRELLYTAVTRAREELYILCEANSFAKGVRTQKIKGTTIAEKLEWFRKKKKEEQMRESLFAKLAGQKEKVTELDTEEDV